MSDIPSLSRRERQIMDVLYKQGKATAAEVRSLMEDPPSYSAVRATLGILEGKGVIAHQEVGGRYIYAPTIGKPAARRSALKRLVNTFFDGSPTEAAMALLGAEKQKLTNEDLDRLSKLVEAARKERT
jgi:predicted transcriptional regulator